MARNKRLIEKLAKLAHEQWTDWMNHMFERATRHSDGSITFQPSDVNRWARQMKTEYDELPDIEQISDRAEALKMIDVVIRHLKV
jgi:hypothetical protein